MADRQRRQLATPHTFNSLVAAAEVITNRTLRLSADSSGGGRAPQLAAWQAEAERFYDSVGELRFGIGWLANGLSRVNLTAARPPRQVGDEPTAIEVDDPETTPAERRAAELVSFIGGGPSGQGQLLHGFGELLNIGGFAWLIAEPDLDDPLADIYESWHVYAQNAVAIEHRNGEPRVMVRTHGGGRAQAWRPAHPNALVVKVWRQHPTRPWEPDAPVRAVLGVLSQIDLLTAHVNASGRSRLAGAGVFVVPTEATFPDPPPVLDDDGNPDPTQDRDGFDYFVEQLSDAMTVPIQDRDSAAAVVPLTVQVPGEFVDKVKHLSFSTPFDERAGELLDQAVKRLALGLDMPPEVLTGMAGVNHWTAWQVEETAITLHLEPAAEIVCNALTVGYLRSALEAENLDPDTAIVWYDTSDLTVPPDKSGNAQAVWDRLQISDAALRRETGFSEDDAPDEAEFRRRLLIALAESAPAVAGELLGPLGILTPEQGAALAQAAAEAAEAEEEAVEEQAAGPPASDRPNGDRAALVAACDGIVWRALERSGAKLRTQIGRKVEGGPQSINGADPTTLHVQYDPTVYADLDMLLDGAWHRVPEVAARYGLPAEELTATLNAYARGLLAARHEHTLERLDAAL